MTNPWRILLLVALLALSLIGGLLALYRIDWIHAVVPGGISITSLIIYAVIAVAAFIGAVFIAAGDSMPIPGKIGRSSGDHRGPDAGDGAVIHHSSGEADFDGSPGDAMPPAKGAQGDLPYPPGRSAD